MFSWCFKCKDPGDEDFQQRPKTRSSFANSSQKTDHTTVSIPVLITTEDLKNVSRKSEQELQQECLEAHNKYRAKHGVNPLILSKHLNALATEWAKHLADSNTLQHRKNNKYGENLYLGTGMGAQSHELAVQAWYEEIKNFNFNKPGFSSNTGHFTQIVWKTTKDLGVGVATRGNRTWVVCNYDPPGNIMGNYLDCVPLPVEEKVSKIIDKMKSQRKFLNYQHKTEATKATTKDEKNNQSQIPASVHRASDLKIWSKYELDCLNSHNKYRAIHGSPSMKLNKKLCNLALDWSKHLAKKRIMSHRPNNEYGENIYYAMNFDPTAEQCVKSWYDEIKNYNYSKPGFSSQTGHFTQVIWKDSIELGVGITKLDNMTFVVCNYSPAGNVMSQYQEQVPPPGAKLTVKPTNSNTNKSNSPVKANEPKESIFEEICLNSHNSFRAIHGSPPMALNKNLNLLANDWAQHLAASNKIESRRNNRFGENIFFAMDKPITGEDPVQHWYSGIQYYNFQKPVFNSTTSSFTQVIWKNSKQLGVGLAKVGRFLYIVCNYNPRGNIIEHFAENVSPVGGECFQLYGKHHTPTQVNFFTVDMLKLHNSYRTKHCSPELKLSNELMNYAKKYVNHFNDNKLFPDAPIYATNICHLQDLAPSADKIVTNWYNEIEKYDFKNPQFTNETRHFTQLVWKDTKFMGVGLIESDHNTIVAVSYEPAGNVEYLYEENISKPI